MMWARFSGLVSSAREGSILPLALVVLSTVGLVVAAGFQAARFASLAADAQLEAAKALHAADTGLDTYGAGSGPAIGTFGLRASWGEARVSASRLMFLPDSGRLVRVQSRAAAPSESSAVGRRHLERLYIVTPAGARHAVAGSWREEM